MALRIAIVDDFYRDPHRVRESALHATYEELPGIVGWRSQAFCPRGIRRRIERAFDLTIVEWPEPPDALPVANGVFFLAFSQGEQAEKLFVHTDEPHHWWTLLVYLTVGAPLDAGTSFWRHRKTGLVRWPDQRGARRLGSSLADVFPDLGRDRRQGASSAWGCAR